MYLGFLLVLFTTARWLRRLVDPQLGWSVVNLVLFAPYLACVPLIVTALRDLDPRRQPEGGAILLMAASIAYPLLLAVVSGRIVPGALEPVRRALPLLTATLILA